MSDAFDPYYIWLGIPPEDQPPHHYRLLGVTLFESNREVIEAAANRQMAYMQEISAGDDHIDEAQKILGELSRARICLLNDEKKVAYDAELRDSFDALTAAAAPEPPATTPVADDPLMPPTFGLPDDEAGDDEAGESAAAPAVGLPPPHTAKAKKQSSLGLIIGLAVLALVLIVGGLSFYLIGEAEKQEQQQTAQREKDAQAEREAKEEDENRAKENDLRVKEAEQRAKDAEQELKHAAEQKAQAEAKRKAKEAAKRKAAEAENRKAAEAKKQKAADAAKRKAAEVAKRKAVEEAKKLAEEEAKKQAKEKAKRKAEEAEREAQELRDNPDKLLKSKGFEPKGKKWAFTQAENLKRYSNKLSKAWKEWKANPSSNEAFIKKKLHAYNELLLETLDVGAMREAVSEDLSQALEDPEVDTAMSKLGVKTKELVRDAKALKKTDAWFKKMVPREYPIIPPFAALIINEDKSVVINFNNELMSGADGPNLFFLPRAIQVSASLRLNFPSPPNETKRIGDLIIPIPNCTIERIRLGRNGVKNMTVQFIPTGSEVEKMPTNIEGAYASLAGKNAWRNFFTKLQPAIVSYSPTAIDAARKKLDAYQPDQK